MIPETDPTPMVARFTFKPDRASDFLEDGQLVTQIEVDTVDEIINYCKEFRDAIVDCNAIINGKAVNLSDFTEPA